MRVVKVDIYNPNNTSPKSGVKTYDCKVQYHCAGVLIMSLLPLVTLVGGLKLHTITKSEIIFWENQLKFQVKIKVNVLCA